MINLGGNALNVYLADLRKNRKLRSNERKRNATDSIVLLDTELDLSVWSC